MNGFFAELLAEILLIYLDIKFWFKKRKQRRYEKANRLPQKSMLYPSDKIGIALFVISLSIAILFGVFIYPSIKISRTEDKLLEIANLLEKEKRDIGVYPLVLETIIRNNPLRKDITKDAWGQEFRYQLSEDSTAYLLFSVGKDRTPKTKDDIVLTDKTTSK
ncbi:type II secretion system protein GspG [Psychroserpens algicola]|uniref:type II secretion system protein GspG n=1 Tax=Psychroserpens algicola TaxID=1719034 RepID=UPI0019539598|nr:type II secretion system protein GspG [Psychroserpens algicola]